MLGGLLGGKSYSSSGGYDGYISFRRLLIFLLRPSLFSLV